MEVSILSELKENVRDLNNLVLGVGLSLVVGVYHADEVLVAEFCKSFLVEVQRVDFVVLIRVYFQGVGDIVLLGLGDVDTEFGFIELFDDLDVFSFGNEASVRVDVAIGGRNKRRLKVGHLKYLV